jgi:predicted small lipoprotein YifL
MHRLALGALLLLLAGCGQKGPLFLPDDEQAAERYGSAEPAPSDTESREKG